MFPLHLNNVPALSVEIKLEVTCQ